MEDILTSLAAIVLCAFLAPIVSFLTPRQLVPEVVVLLGLGMLIGPHGLSLATHGQSIELLAELGLAFLFLLAGYEIDPDDLKGRNGVTAGGTWLVTLALAFGVSFLVFRLNPFGLEGAAVAIAMTSTAIGTLFPILKERGVLTKRIGPFILAHGAVGEIGPIIAMALLLTVRAQWISVVVLLIFLASALIIAAIPGRARKAGRKIVKFLHMGSESTAQTTMRGTMLLLVSLVTFASLMELDLVLGAFAAGFIMRQAVPDGRVELEKKLDGLAYGFFIPVFFVVSGMGIDISVAASQPIGWIFFLVLFVLVRGLPVFIATFLPACGAGIGLSLGDRVSAALYSSTALPIIVAVTAAAESAEAMSNEAASTLILAGAASVLVMPMIVALIPITEHEDAKGSANGAGSAVPTRQALKDVEAESDQPSVNRKSHDAAYDEDDHEELGKSVEDLPRVNEAGRASADAGAEKPGAKKKPGAAKEKPEAAKASADEVNPGDKGEDPPTA